MNHKVGDKVVALSDPMTERSQPRIKGKIYVVKAVAYCPFCGCQSINIGVKVKDGRCKCSNQCGTRENRGLAWTNSRHFANLYNLDEAIRVAVEGEEYELAMMLTDLQKKFKNK